MPNKYLDNLTLIYSNPFHCSSTFTITQYQTVQSSFFFWEENTQLIEKQPLPFISKDHRSNAEKSPLYSLLFLNRKVQDEYSKLPKENQKDFMQQGLDKVSLISHSYQHPRLKLYTGVQSSRGDSQMDIHELLTLFPITFYSHLQYRIIITCHFNLPLFQFQRPCQSTLSYYIHSYTMCTGS